MFSLPGKFLREAEISESNALGNQLRMTEKSWSEEIGRGCLGRISDQTALHFRTACRLPCLDALAN